MPALSCVIQGAAVACVGSSGNTLHVRPWAMGRASGEPGSACLVLVASQAVVAHPSCSDVADACYCMLAVVPS